MRTIRLTLAYDGTSYVGWQIQPNGLTVQAVVEDALQKLTGETIKVVAAGRTDSGVHALGQVVSFRTAATIPISAFQPGLQHFLPDDVVVRDAAEAAESFHATYSATCKRYRYVIHNSRVADPFLRRYAWRISAPLDATAMHEAAQILLGTHDFRCFESQFPNKATSVRTVFEAAVGRCGGWPVWEWTGSLAADECEWTIASGKQPGGRTGQETRATEGGVRVPVARVSRPVRVASQEGPGDFLWFDIAANGFLYNMVRAITGTLVKVGLGRWSPEDVRQIIARQDRAQAGETAPPQGLYLVQVDYVSPETIQESRSPDE
jgi:tRNA pseudouridine38-40 synthase